MKRVRQEEKMERRKIKSNLCGKQTRLLQGLLFSLTTILTYSPNETVLLSQSFANWYPVKLFCSKTV